MKLGGRAWTGGAVLGTLALLAVLAPLLGLRDPNDQPDELVLGSRPPGSQVARILLADGSVRHADELQAQPDGSLRYRRGERWSSVEAHELAADWNRPVRYPLGTDGFGRDLLSRLVYGGRISLAVGLLSAAVALLIGSSIGLLSGLAGGRTDALLMRGADFALSIPRLFLAVLLVSLYGKSLWTTVLVLGGTTWMAAARIVRGQALSLRERPFVEAARASGAPPARIALRHLLPGVLPALLVEATLRVGDTILLESALSFLGLGVQPPTPSWGNLIADGRASLSYAWWIATLPGLAIVVTVVSLHLLSDGLRDRFTARR